MAETGDGDVAAALARASSDGTELEQLGEWLRPRNTAQQISDRFVTALALGEFVAGQRLPSERNLAAMLGVSRGRVRAALHELADQGFVEIRRGRHGGTFVASAWGPSSESIIRRTLLPDWHRIEQLLDLLLMIEPLIAKTAAERRSAADLKTIRAAATAYRKAADRAESAEGDRDFHAALAAASGNGYLVELSSRLNQEVTLGFRAHPYSAEIRKSAVEQHDALAEMVAHQEPTEAAALMVEHMQLSEDAIKSLVSKVRAREDLDEPLPLRES